MNTSLISTYFNQEFSILQSGVKKFYLINMHVPVKRDFAGRSMTTHREKKHICFPPTTRLWFPVPSLIWIMQVFQNSEKITGVLRRETCIWFWHFCPLTQLTHHIFHWLMFPWFPINVSFSKPLGSSPIWWKATPGSAYLTATLTHHMDNFVIRFCDLHQVWSRYWQSL